MDDLPMVDVVEARALDGFKLWLKFSDGCESATDLSEFIASGGPMVEPLKDPLFFARVFVAGDVPTGSNGLDLDAINLYMDLDKAGALKRAAA